jgi:hypothetical protein
MVVVPEPDEPGTQQCVRAEVERGPHLFLNLAENLGFLVRAAPVAKVDVSEVGASGEEHWLRYAIHDRDNGSEHFVAAHDLVKGAPQGLDIE